MNQDESRPLYPATCADCGQATQVPFQPSGDRPVYCKDCFQKHRTQRGSYGGQREMYDATCADCGQATQVPFKPSGDRPVYCRDCFREMSPRRESRGGYRPR